MTDVPTRDEIAGVLANLDSDDATLPPEAKVLVSTATIDTTFLRGALRLALRMLDLEVAASEAVTKGMNADAMTAYADAMQKGMSAVPAEAWPRATPMKSALFAIAPALVLAGAIKAKLWDKARTDNDLPLPEDKAIDAAHPLHDDRNGKLFQEALRLVGARRSKYGLVELVTWLLARERDTREAGREQGIATVEEDLCPFCGSVGEVCGDDDAWAVHCESKGSIRWCNAHGPIGDTPEQAREAWKTRARKARALGRPA